ncbi:MAG: hypothetical protein PHY54_11860 [Methylococcales bacterium]|nr:hypothetical protein [Methylococcales bacterium]
MTVTLRIKIESCFFMGNDVQASLSGTPTLKQVNPEASGSAYPGPVKTSVAGFGWQYKKNVRAKDRVSQSVSG